MTAPAITPSAMAPRLTLARTQVAVLQLLLQVHDRMGPEGVREIVDVTDPATTGGQSPKARATNWHATFRMTRAKLERVTAKERGAYTIDFSWNQVERTLAVCRYWDGRSLSDLVHNVVGSAVVARMIRQELPALITLFAGLMEHDPIEAETREATCVKCGCTDSRACAGGCSWVRVDRAKGEGLCSECVP